MPGGATVIVYLTAEITAEVKDTGYLGAGASVEEHVKHALDAANNWQVLIKQGSLNAEVTPVLFKVRTVEIIPNK